MANVRFWPSGIFEVWKLWVKAVNCSLCCLYHYVKPLDILATGERTLLYILGFW